MSRGGILLALGLLLSACLTLLPRHASTQSVIPFTADYLEFESTGDSAPDVVIEGRYYRDSLGRLRQEDWKRDGAGQRSEHRVIIADPHREVHYTLPSAENVAVRRPLKRCRRETANVAPQPAPNAWVEVNLGEKVVEGVVAHGRRSCDSATGRCLETWWAPELRYMVRMLETQPGGLTRLKRWHNFQMGVEPEEALFQVPAHYRILDKPLLPGCGEAVVLPADSEPKSRPAVNQARMRTENTGEERAT